jgi:hypothetical protein
MATADKPDYIAEHAHVAEAARAVGAMLAELQPVMEQLQQLDTASLELEGRLGRFGPSGFDPDVGSSAFCAILGMLESYHGWSHVSQWEETQDVFFSATLPPGFLSPEDDGRPVQVRTSVNSGGPKGATMEIAHIVKKKLRRVDLALQNVDVGACALGTQAAGCAAFPLDARVATSLEWVVPPDVLPVAVRPDLVRIKQRRSFFLPSPGVDGDCFRFDVTIVYRGRTKSDAEGCQQAGKGASFEVECECLAPQAYMHSSSGDPLCLALSMVVKLLDFASALNPASCVTFVPTPARRGERPLQLGRPI